MAQRYQRHDDMRQQETGGIQPAESEDEDKRHGKVIFPAIQLLQVQIIPLVTLVDE